MAGSIFERMGVHLMTRALNISSQRQRVIAGNVSNAMTPGYIRKEVNFEENLARAMGKSSMDGLTADQRHIPIGDTRRGRNPVIMNDVNAPNVDIEKEMAASAENQLLYATVAKTLSGKFKSLRMVIRGRG